jgi:cation diffusion facilitator family transporter
VNGGILPEMDRKNTPDDEKRAVAFGSVLAAVLLTSMKILVGILTGSLGILSEAAHSGLDLIAAIVTFFAVRISGQPADQVHTYGHGKVENLSALFETILLLVTCVWIIYEAIQRLFYKHVEVDASIWAFIIMAVSIVVDVTRSRALARVAKLHNSQALEADALHFSTDVWSSTVVILGLLFVSLARWLDLPWLAQADAIAAMGVAGIVVYVSLELGLKTISDLLDAVPPGLRDKVQQVAGVPGVAEVSRVRVRRSGPAIFTDVTLRVNRGVAFENAHDISELAEASIKQLLPGADVVVHVEPVIASDEDLHTTVRLLASRRGLGAHSIRVNQAGKSRSLELHLEVDDRLSLVEAHAMATEFERDLRQALPGFENITTHIEPDMTLENIASGSKTDRERVRQALTELLSERGMNCRPHNLRVVAQDGELAISFHCNIDPIMPISEAHALTEKVEQDLRTRIPNLGRVVIHVEPAGRNDQNR